MFPLLCFMCAQQFLWDRSYIPDILDSIRAVTIEREKRAYSKKNSFLRITCRCAAGSAGSRKSRKKGMNWSSQPACPLHFIIRPNPLSPLLLFSLPMCIILLAVSIGNLFVFLSPPCYSLSLFLPQRVHTTMETSNYG